MQYQILTTAAQKDVEDINKLLPQLSRSEPQTTLGELQALVSSQTTKIMVVRDCEKIIGTGSLILVNQLTGKWATIEDVVVDEAYRGQGIGKTLMVKLIQLAKESGLAGISLTSRPSRVAANALYPKLGFKLKETNFYELEF